MESSSGWSERGRKRGQEGEAREEQRRESPIGTDGDNPDRKRKTVKEQQVTRR